ncbi:MAG: DUF2079 domain-containing protein [Actinobacteria bacterium]|nr:DUF2079 domain-containing protein [Actinomycetota bacterium]MBU4217932.1 DUF2079 domain-containing protein [Actinomycetota bacterium]MBU4360035.1 DUF2079 domain-containing protein [Actinomycetota bacterium]MBU4392995.1 DUF2079 domain-containing protein [Actinomycetota bacterium]MBU4402118.1 DUF2079 domain-containing protein [Actinomycetota bacterium]
MADMEMTGVGKPEKADGENAGAKKGQGSGERRPDRAFLIFVLVLIGGYIALFLTLSLLRYANFRASSLDTAIFNQVTWLLSRFDGATSTIRGMNLFGDHMAPILFLLMPLYWVRGNAPALLAIQTVALGLGALPLYLLARDKLKSRPVALAVAVAYLAYPALQHFNLFDFHPESLGLCFLLFAFLAIDRKKFTWFYVLCFAAAICKEDMVLAVLVLGLLVYFKYDRRAGKIVAIGSAGYFLVSVLFLLPAFAPVGYQYGGRLGQFGETPLEAARNMAFHPLRTFNILATRQNLRYFFDLLLPVGFLCLLAPTYLLPAAPAFIINMVSSFSPQHTILNQYTAAMTPFIFIAVIFGLRKIKNWAEGGFRQRYVMGAVAFVMIACAFAGNFYFGPSPLSGSWNTKLYSSDSHIDAMREGISMIPEDASVSAQVFMLAHLSQRKHLYMFPEPFVEYVDREYFDGLGDGAKIIFPQTYRHLEKGADTSEFPLPEVEYIALDSGSSVWPLPADQYEKVVGGVLESGEYRTVFERDGVMILKKRD